jgi:hypothetical protein
MVPRKASRVLEKICEQGITVVTLIDGKEYTEAALDDDPMALLTSTIIFIRANEESRTKANRLKAAWAQKRTTAGAHKLTARAPAWLRLNREANRFEVIKDRAAIVRRIFSETLAGVGQNGIAKALNLEGVPVFGDADGKRTGMHWHGTYVAKIRANPAVIGTFTPHRIEHENGRKVRKPEEPVPGYFPAVVDETTYRRVEALRLSASNPRRGRHAAHPVTNIFGGVGRCPACEATMTVVNKTSAKDRRPYRYFVCTRAKAKAPNPDGSRCPYRVVAYERVERVFLDRSEEVLEDRPAESEEAESIAARLEEIDATMLVLSTKWENLTDAIARSHHRPAGVLAEIAEIEAQRDKLKEEENALGSQMAGLSLTLVDHKVAAAETALRPVLAAIEDARKQLRAKAKTAAEKAKAEDGAWAVADAALGPAWRGEVNTIFRQLFKAVVVDYRTGRLEFLWQHGGETSIVFAWPKDDAA